MLFFRIVWPIFTAGLVSDVATRPMQQLVVICMCLTPNGEIFWFCFDPTITFDLTQDGQGNSPWGQQVSVCNVHLFF